MSLLKRRYFVSGGVSKTLNFWDPSQGKWLYGMNRAQDGFIQCITNFGTEMFATASDDSIIFWKWKQKKKIKELHGDDYMIESLLPYPFYSRKPSHIISGSSDCIIRMWKTDSNECVGKLIGHTSGVLKLSSYGDEKIMSASEDSTVRIWSVEKEKLLCSLKEEKTDSGKIFCLAYDKKTNVTFSGTETGQVNMWENEKLITQISNIRSSVQSILCLPKNQFIFGDKAGRVFCYDQRKVDRRVWKSKIHRNVVSDMINNRDGGTITSCSWDASIRIFKIEDGKVLRRMKCKRELRCLCVLESSKKRKCPFTSSSPPQTLSFKRDLTRTRVQLSQAALNLSSPRFILPDFLENVKNIRRYIHSQTNKKVLDDHCYYLCDVILEEIEKLRNQTYILREGRSMTIYVGDWSAASAKNIIIKNKKMKMKKKSNNHKTSNNRKNNFVKDNMLSSGSGDDDNSNNTNNKNDRESTIHHSRRLLKRRRSLSCGLPLESSMYSPMKTPKKVSEFQVSGNGRIFTEDNKRKGLFTLVYEGEVRRNHRHGFGKTFEIFNSRKNSPVDEVLKLNVGVVSSNSSNSNGNSSSTDVNSPSTLSPIGAPSKSNMINMSPLRSPIPTSKKKNNKKNKKMMKKKRELLNIFLKVKFVGMFRNDAKNGFGMTIGKSSNKIGVYQNGKFVEKLEDILSKTEKYNVELEREFVEFTKYKKMHKVYYCLTAIWENSLQEVMDSISHFKEEFNMPLTLSKKKRKKGKEVEETEGEEEEEENIINEVSNESDEDEDNNKNKKKRIKRDLIIDSRKKIIPFESKEKLIRRIERIGMKARQLIKSYDKRMELVKFGEYKYLGNWVRDTFSGEGSLYIRQGSKKKRLSLSNLMKKKYRLIYYGEFEKGKKEGIGRMYDEDGKTIKFFGRFQNNEKHGQGVEYSPANVGEGKNKVGGGQDSQGNNNNGGSSKGGAKVPKSNSFDKVILREGEWNKGKFIGRKKRAKVKEMDLSWFFKEILSDPKKTRDHFIGQGTFAQVYRLFFSKFGWCAFKYFPHASSNPGQLAQIRSEMELMSQLDHENVIKLFAFSMKEPVGLVQEFLDISLNTFIDRLWTKNKEKKKVVEEEGEKEDDNGYNDVLEERISILKTPLFRKKMKIILGTARGMEYLHSNHVMHRDLKWDNIMLDKNGVVKIIDFGFSKWIKSFMPQRNTYGKVGSPFYIAPEVLTGSTGGNYKYKCDVFSFGIMLYELLFDTLDPYDIASREDYFGSIEWDVAKKGVRPKIKKEFVSIDNPELAWIIELMKRCWDNDPQKRPTFTEILQEIHSNTYFLIKT